MQHSLLFLRVKYTNAFYVRTYIGLSNIYLVSGMYIDPGAWSIDCCSGYGSQVILGMVEWYILHLAALRWSCVVLGLTIDVWSNIGVINIIIRGWYYTIIIIR